MLGVRKKMVNTLVYIIKRKLLDGLKNNILLAALVRKILFSPLEKKKFISSRPRVMSTMY